MALAVIGVVMSIAVIGTRWIVAPTTGWPGFVAALEALTTWPENEFPGA
jgi:hypothetical protein